MSPPEASKPATRWAKAHTRRIPAQGKIRGMILAHRKRRRMADRFLWYTSLYPIGGTKSRALLYYRFTWTFAVT